MIFAVKGALLLGSFLGYCFVLRQKARMQAEFVPVTVLCGTALALYLAGLMHMLRLGSYLVYSVGLALCLYMMWQIARKKYRPPYMTLFRAGFLLGAVVFCGLSLLLRLEHYDNFSHWATVVKQMYNTNAFPTLEDAIVSFKDYPPGSSVLVYYGCLLWDNAQGVMLLMQNALLLAGFYAMFGLVKERKRFLVYSFIGMGGALLSYLNLTIRINNLLIDFLMPVLSVAALAAIEALLEKPKQLAGVLLPVLGLITIMKSTGVVFAALPLLYLAWRLVGQKHWGALKRLAYLVGLAAFSMLPYLLWKVHLALELPGLEEKFAADSQSAELMAVGQQLYGQITRDFLEGALALSSRAAVCFWLCNLVVIAVCVFARLRLKKKLCLGKTLLAMDLVAVLYYGGILYMYLFLMPADEAVVLAGFERYACSIMVFFAGGLILAGAKDIESLFYFKNVTGDTYKAYRSPATKQRYQMLVLVSVLIMGNFLYSEIAGLWEIRGNYPNTIAGRTEALVGDQWYRNGSEDDARYLVIATDRDSPVYSHELSYTMRYFLYAPYVDVMLPMSEAELQEKLPNYDKIIVFEEGAVTAKNGKYTLDALRQQGIYESADLQAAFAAAQRV